MSDHPDFLPDLPGVIRRLWPTDRGRFLDHLLRLDADSRHSRFGGAVSADFLERYAERCFGAEDVLYGYIEDGVVRGAGELRGIGHNLPLGFGGSAEAAFSVESKWRGKGIGAALMGRIVRAARNRRADTLYMTCLTSNQAMLALARKFSAQIRLEPDEAWAMLDPHGPTMESLIDEYSDEVAGFATAMLDLQRRALAMGVPGERKRA